MLLRKPLSINALGSLLHVETGHILHTLLGIQSILVVPEDDDQSIRLVHTSLRDFLLTRPRSRDWYIDPPAHHLRIAIDCLIAITVPPENGISYVGFRKYACSNWCHHFHQCLGEGGENNVIIYSLSETALTNCLVKFVSESLDPWINTTILERNWQVVLEELGLALLKLKVSLFFV
jgi:hypothetical protein